MTFLHGSIYISLALFRLTLAYPSGPPTSGPTSACESMTPNHGRDAMVTDPPFIITVSPSGMYSSRDTLTVSLQATDGGSFKGFFVQARPADGGSITSYGAFTTNGTGQQTADCFGTGEDVISHSSSEAKTEVTFTWRPLSTDTHNVRFRATVARLSLMFWENILSDVVTYVPADTTTNPVTTSTDQSNPHSTAMTMDSRTTADGGNSIETSHLTTSVTSSAHILSYTQLLIIQPFLLYLFCVS